MSEIRPGDRVRVRKGARCRSMHPQRRGGYVTGRAFVVTVVDVFGEVTTPGYESPATVEWAGSGGYWCWCPVAEVERVDAVESGGRKA